MHIFNNFIVFFLSLLHFSFGVLIAWEFSNKITSIECCIIYLLCATRTAWMTLRENLFFFFILNECIAYMANKTNRRSEQKNRIYRYIYIFVRFESWTRHFWCNALFGLYRMWFVDANFPKESCRTTNAFLSFFISDKKKTQKLRQRQKNTQNYTYKMRNKYDCYIVCLSFEMK